MLTDTKTNRPRTLPQHHLLHIFDEQIGARESIDSLLKKNFIVWNKSLGNEWGCHAQGNIHCLKATDTIEFIPITQVPANAKVTYASFVCDHRPLKP